MIQNILLPEKFRSYYLFPKRVVGFEITKNYVFATVVYLHGYSASIEQCTEVAIEQDNGQELTSRTAVAIKKALTAIGKYSTIHVSVSSSQAVFKNMKLPFDDYEKIERIIDFEVEPLLPFSIHDAVIDFIITKQNSTEKSSEVCVAALQKQYIKQTLDLFHEAGVQPEVVTIDLFELYGLYKMIPSYNNISGGALLIEIGFSCTKIAYILDGQLKFIRTLTLGTTHIAKSIGTHLSLPIKDAMEELLRHGFEKQQEPTFAEAINTAADSFVSKLKFTMQSFMVQSNPEEQVSHAFLLGIGATIKGFDSWLDKSLKITCAIFNPDHVTENPHINLKKIAHIPVENSISTSIAMPNQTTEHFNLLQKEFAPSDSQLLLKQIITNAILLILLFGSLLMHSFFQVRALRTALEKSHKEASAILVEWFPNIEEQHLDVMIEEAQEEAKKEEKLWFSFSKNSKTSCLNFLLELTRLDREGLGLIFDKISIDQDKGVLTIKAQVRDHEALKRFESELEQTKLFSYIPKKDTSSFTTELRFATGPGED
jgi:type IV pilus assembly protein PilM